MHQFQNIPAFKFALLLITGILIGSKFYYDLHILICLIIVVIIFAVLFFKKKIAMSTIASWFIILLLGVLKSNLDFFIIPDNSIKYFGDTERKSSSELVGIIKDYPDYDTNKIRFVLESEELISSNEKFIVSGDVSILLREDFFKKSHSEQPYLKPGDRIVVKGQLLEPPSVRNPGEFDYKKYLELHEIHKIFISTGYKNIKVIETGKYGFVFQKIIFPAKAFALENIDENLSGDEAGYLKGLVTGSRNDISSETKDAFINAGVMHLIAVSGLNVAYIIIFVTIFLSLLRIPLLPKTILTILILIFYCQFTGSPASIVRATIMGILLMLSFLLERRLNFYNTIGIAAIIILLHDSKQLFDAGFILSFSAVLSMAFIFISFEKVFMQKIIMWNFKGRKILLGAATLLFTTLAAQIGTLPITVNYFGKISFISLLANIVVVPIANLSLAIGFFQILVAIISPLLSNLISETNNVILSAQLLFINWCASLRFAYINVPDFNLLNVSAYYIVIVFIVTINNKNQILFRTVLSFLILAALFLYSFEFKKNLRITFIDVGQGDCALIQTPDDEIILVDCGIITYTYNSGERTIAPLLRRNGIDKIDLIILTHLHNDHIGGINYLLNNFKIGKILESGQKHESKLIDTMDSLIFVKKIQRETVKTGDLINAIKDIRLYFLFPDNVFVNSAGQTIDGNLNNGSVTFIMQYQENKFMFPGDIEKEGEKNLHETYSDYLKADVLKVAHHGSITSTTVPFILKNKPSVSVISCGMFNKFNHPSDIVLQRLKTSGSDVYRTDLQGAVIIESDGRNIEIVEWK
ncbi:MAG: DNA internalization-related competence protein ComEC/Rec2 [Ignavibacteria bacterium]